MQQRSQARQCFIRKIGMPEMTGIDQSNRFIVFDNVGNDQHFWILRQLELTQHMDLQPSKTAAEIDLLLRRDALLSEYHDMMIQMCLMDAPEVGFRQPLR